MENQKFTAFVVEETSENTFSGSIQTRTIADLPQGDLLVKVHYSSLNYKDALSANGNRGVTREYPHTPGIDAVGEVVQCDTGDFSAGDKVIVTSYDLGMNTDGGFGQYIRVPSQWALPLPEKLSMKESMMYGTAGLTAGMCISMLTEKVTPDHGKIAVSGATGGVGAMAISILYKLGYEVAAITGKESEKDFLLQLGAKEVIAREDFQSLADRPMLKPQFAGGVDTVGGVILENIIKSTNPMGVVSCCGNAASPKLQLTVFPFILRGVSLVGADSQNFPMEYRKQVWAHLADDWKPESLAETCQEVSLDQVAEKIDLMYRGEHVGRTIIRVLS